VSRVRSLEFSAIVPTLKPDIGIANDLRQVGSRIANDRAVIGCLEGIDVIDTVIHKPKTWILDIRATKSVVSASVAPIDRKPTDTLLVATRASEKAGQFHIRRSILSSSSSVIVGGSLVLRMIGAGLTHIGV
jgi:hypothetical protein